MPCRGHLGLGTFACILSDPRTRDLPLILETPAYDNPSAGARDTLATEGMAVWRTEVSVLNRVSGRLVESSGQPEGDGCGAPELLHDGELEACRAEVADAVSHASKLRDGKGRKTEGKVTGRKGKRKEAQDDDDDHIDSCDE